jgi:hypothetical protein
MLGDTPAHAGEGRKVYEVIRDTRGRRIFTVECDLTDQCVIRDTRGRRTGTIEDAENTSPWGFPPPNEQPEDYCPPENR